MLRIGGKKCGVECEVERCERFSRKLRAAVAEAESDWSALNRPVSPPLTKGRPATTKPTEYVFSDFLAPLTHDTPCSAEGDRGEEEEGDGGRGVEDEEQQR